MASTCALDFTQLSGSSTAQLGLASPNDLRPADATAATEAYESLDPALSGSHAHLVRSPAISNKAVAADASTTPSTPLVVELASVPTVIRGKLASYIDEQIERALGIRGAASRYSACWTSDESPIASRFDDQIARAAAVGATGIDLVIRSLASIAAPSLTPEDSETLRDIVLYTYVANLRLSLSPDDMALPAYAAPVALREVLACPDAPRTPVAREPDASPREQEQVPEHAVSRPPSPEETAPRRSDAHRDHARPQTRPTAWGASPETAWRGWAAALTAARGPQPPATFERLFVDNYMPLTRALNDGAIDDSRAVHAYEQFRDDFARGYADAFAAFGATSRRPPMVMDAFEVAAKQARLHNARCSHVLLVEGLRYDLGREVRTLIEKSAHCNLSLTHESILWSALPTTTFRQLETLARGVDALRAPAAEEPGETLHARATETVRRLRVGSRELYKLDTAAAALGALGHADTRKHGEPFKDALANAAQGVTNALLRHIETLAPRTLIVVIGDRGFTVDSHGRVRHGGASPEEVLVPCLAYFFGDLH